MRITDGWEVNIRAPAYLTTNGPDLVVVLSFDGKSNAVRSL